MHRVMESINNLNIMKGNKMFKKINNHGFGLVPILVLSLFVGVLGVFTYNYYSSNEVLSMKGVGSLSQRPGDGIYLSSKITSRYYKCNFGF